MKEVGFWGGGWNWDWDWIDFFGGEGKVKKKMSAKK